MKKGDSIRHIAVETMAAEGKCIGHHEGQVVFLKGCAPGDVVTARLTKIKKQYLEATTTEIETLSDRRATPPCVHFGLCGGCSWQHIQYEEQLKYKQQQVVDHLTRIGGIAIPSVNPIIGSAKQLEYRNKLDYTFTANRWKTREELDDPHMAERFEKGLGYHIPKMYDRVFDVQTCHLQPHPSNEIRLQARETALREDISFFDLRKQVGFLRTLTIRTATSGEVMVILQVAFEQMDWVEAVLGDLVHAFPEITSVNYIINGKRNDTFADLDVVCWKGKPFITEYMPTAQGQGKLAFRVGPKSFYQTNSLQAAVLYQQVWRMAALTGQELVYDLYTGSGTIANYVAPGARKVVGVDYMAESIEAAFASAELNGINNTHFLAGDMKYMLDENFVDRYGAPNVVITDPPRAGMHKNVCARLLALAPERIVYVSCNPATQARDLEILSTHYDVVEIQPVDMFPHTVHVENVVLLVLK